MAGTVSDISPDQAARIAGASWLIIIFTGIAAEFFIRMPLIVAGDAIATAENISASRELFRIGIAADAVMLVFDVVAAVFLYALFSRVNKSLALLATGFRLVMNAVLAANLVTLMLVLLFAGSTDAATMQFFLDAHGSGYDIALVFFGLHCAILGYLIYRSDYVPKMLGILLLSASLGYLIDSFAHLLLPQGNPVLATTAAALVGIAVVAELSLSLWLLLKGIGEQKALS